MTARIARVVVPFDAASETGTAIDTAARLAARAKAPLHGIFVEDEELLQLAALPCARQVTMATGAEPLTTEHLELHLRAAAEAARAALAAAAKRHGVAWSFEIVRGRSERAIPGMSEGDLIVAGALSRPIAGHFRVEWRWWSSVELVPGPLLLARGGGGDGGPVVVLLRDRGAKGVRLIDTAAQIAEASGGALTVICPPALAGEEGFEKWIADRLAAYSARVQIEVAEVEPAGLDRRIAELGCRLLAIEAAAVESGGDRLREFAGRLSCDVLIIR